MTKIFPAGFYRVRGVPYFMRDKGKELYFCIIKFFFLLTFEYFTVDAVFFFQFGFFIVIPEYDQQA